MNHKYSKPTGLSILPHRLRRTRICSVPYSGIASCLYLRQSQQSLKLGSNNWAASLVADALGNIRYRIGLTAPHIFAFPLSGGDILINTIITLDQFCETQITEFATGFGDGNADHGNEFVYGLMALGAQ